IELICTFEVVLDEYHNEVIGIIVAPNISHFSRDAKKRVDITKHNTILTDDTNINIQTQKSD
ncbi:218_t:CDS:1, partial [Entrophospora sp. SA101]